MHPPNRNRSNDTLGDVPLLPQPTPIRPSTYSSVTISNEPPAYDHNGKPPAYIPQTPPLKMPEPVHYDNLALEPAPDPAISLSQLEHGSQVPPPYEDTRQPRRLRYSRWWCFSFFAIVLVVVVMWAIIRATWHDPDGRDSFD